MIDVHYCPTPNGIKVAIMLEEIGVDYRIIAYEMMKGDHLQPGFAKLNLNHKLPVIVDHDPIGKGPPFVVFESGAILLYLADKTGLFFPRDPRARHLVNQWLMWQMAGLGPMHGQAHHFVRYAPEDQEYGRTRYVREAGRLLMVLEKQLRDVEYVAGDYSIADIAIWPWVMGATLLNLDMNDYPNVCRWKDTIAQRQAVIRVTSNAETAMTSRYAQSRMRLTPAEWSNLFGEAMLSAPCNVENVC